MDNFNKKEIRETEIHLEMPQVIILLRPDLIKIKIKNARQILKSRYGLRCDLNRCKQLAYLLIWNNECLIYFRKQFIMYVHLQF